MAKLMNAADEPLKPKSASGKYVLFTQALKISLAAIVSTSSTAAVAESTFDTVGVAFPRLQIPVFSQTGPASNPKEFAHQHYLGEAVSEVERNRPEILNNIAGLAYRQGRYSDALRMLEQAVGLSPSYASIEQNLTLLRQLAASGDSAEASNPGRNFLLIDTSPKPGVLLAKCDAEHVGAQRLPRCITTSGEETAIAPRSDSLHLSDTWQDAVTDKPTPINLKVAWAAGPDLDEISQVKRQLAAWVNNWEQREIGTYLSMYGPDFAPAMGRVKWELMRHVRLAGARNIKVEISELQVQVQTRPSTVMTSFIQHYRSERFSDQVRKILLWRQHQGRWRIASEETRPWGLAE